LTRKEIFEILKNNLKAAAEMYDKIGKVMSAKVRPLRFTLTDKYKGTLKTFTTQIRNKWSDCHRMETRFYKDNDEWLKVFIKKKIIYNLLYIIIYYNYI